MAPANIGDMEHDDYQTPAAYLKALRKRTKELREKSGRTQAEMAQFLGLSLEVYKKYENRSPLPHRFISHFCALVGADEAYFLTGKSKAQKKNLQKTG